MDVPQNTVGTWGPQICGGYGRSNSLTIPKFGLEFYRSVVSHFSFSRLQGLATDAFSALTINILTLLTCKSFASVRLVQQQRQNQQARNAIECRYSAAVSEEGQQQNQYNRCLDAAN